MVQYFTCVLILSGLFLFQYAVENEELTQHLGAAKDAQRQLTAEVRQVQAPVLHLSCIFRKHITCFCLLDVIYFISYILVIKLTIYQ